MTERRAKRKKEKRWMEGRNKRNKARCKGRRMKEYKKATIEVTKKGWTEAMNKEGIKKGFK